MFENKYVSKSTNIFFLKFKNFIFYQFIKIFELAKLNEHQYHFFARIKTNLQHTKHFLFSENKDGEIICTRTRIAL